jgi:Na+-translocating ferredoxin:NAD+ oxidoreductase RnfD subunit
MAARRFFRTPKGLLLLLLAPVLAVAAAGAGVRLVAPGALAAVAAAIAIDTPLLRLRSTRWHLPSGAVLTALLVAMVLSPHEPWYVPAVTTAIAILSKYVFRIGPANVFNPAALGLVATFYWFDTGQSWWGALPDGPPFTIALLFATGIFITARVNKMPVVLTFLTGYFLLFTVTAYAGEPRLVSEVFRTPDVQAVLFFAFFMVTDPPTSPVRHREQVIYAGIAAVASYAAFERLGAACYLLIGLLVANGWEGWRRYEARRRRRQGR